jgi:hypothetical protein
MSGGSPAACFASAATIVGEIIADKANIVKPESVMLPKRSPRGAQV